MKADLYISLIREKQQAWQASSLIMEEALLSCDYERFFSELGVRGQIIEAYQDLLNRLISVLQDFSGEFQPENVLPFLLSDYSRIGLSEAAADVLRQIKATFADLRVIEDRINAQAETLPSELEKRLKQFQGKKGMIQAYDQQRLQLAGLYSRFEKRH